MGVTLDAATWLAASALLITFAAVLARRAPIRSAFIMACGIGQVLGVILGVFRVRGVGERAARYVMATPEQQADLLWSYQDIALVMDSFFTVHWALFSLAFVLAASAARTMAEFPRWLTIGLALLGVFGVAHPVILLLTGANIGKLTFAAFIRVYAE